MKTVKTLILRRSCAQVGIKIYRDLARQILSFRWYLPLGTTLSICKHAAKNIFVLTSRTKSETTTVMSIGVRETDLWSDQAERGTRERDHSFLFCFKIPKLLRLMLQTCFYVSYFLYTILFLLVYFLLTFYAFSCSKSHF